MYDDVLIHSQFEVLDLENLDTFTYVQKYEGKRALVGLNFSEGEQSFDLPPAPKHSRMSLLVSTFEQLEGKPSG